MAKKWAHLVGTLPTLPSGDPTYEEALRVKVEEISALSIKEIGDAFVAAGAEVKRLDALLSDANFIKEAHERALLAAMKKAGLEAVTIDGRAYSESAEPYAKIEDKAAFLKDALVNFTDSLSMHAQTLNSLCKQAITGEGRVPEGVTLFLKTKLSNKKA